MLAAEPDFEVAGQCSSSTEALQWLSRSEVNVVLLDFDLGKEEGSHFISAARHSGYAGKILMVTAGMNATESSLALKMGASGIVLKHNSPGILANAIRQVVHGEMWVDQKVIQEMAEQFPQGNLQNLPRTLTRREEKVLRGVFEGLANKEIAAQIGVSETLIKATLQQLFHKTGVRTRSQLVRIAIERSFCINKKL